LPGPCIVTGANSAQFDLVQPWLCRLRLTNPRVPIVFADLGLTGKERAWLEPHGRVTRPACDPFAEAWFAKPDAILTATHSSILWLDLDIDVIGSLGPLWVRHTPAAGLALASDPPMANRFPGMGNAGVITVRHGDAVVLEWAAKCRAPKERSDQEELYRLGVRGGGLPQEYNWLRLMGTPPRSIPFPTIRHWTGPAGKGIIRGRLAHEFANEPDALD
jgi:hypothetical protein